MMNDCKRFLTGLLPVIILSALLLQGQWLSVNHDIEHYDGEHDVYCEILLASKTTTSIAPDAINLFQGLPAEQLSSYLYDTVITQPVTTGPIRAPPAYS
jgi:hypothetical protein